MNNMHAIQKIKGISKKKNGRNVKLMEKQITDQLNKNCM